MTEYKTNGEPMITYRHQDDRRVRFRQYAKDPIPVWAVDVQLDVQLDVQPDSLPTVDGAAHIPKGWRLVPEEPTEDMVNAALLSTAGFLNITGSQLTVNREKMRIRYKAMLAKAPKNTSDTDQ